MAEFFLEILSEEMPAGMQQPAAVAFEKLVTEALTAAGFAFHHQRSCTTPRRLMLMVDGLTEAQPDVSEEKRGPRVDAPDKALQGFANSLTGSVSLSWDWTALKSIDPTSGGLTFDLPDGSKGDIRVSQTEKGAFLFGNVHKKGRPTAEVLATLIPEMMAKLPWPKSMRWGDPETRCVRPIQRITCLFAGKVVPFRFGPVATGDTTVGHRFHAPGEFRVTGYDDYRIKLDGAHVMLSAHQREEFIRTGDGLDAAHEGLVVVEDEGLREEVAGLVEWPVILMGKIDEAFMDVPEEVLVTTMKKQQRYFALRDRAGKLAPRFIVVANVEAADGGKAIIAGNERVLRARFSDAKFFWDQDRKKTLESRVPELEKVTFHAKLGTLAQRMARVGKLAEEIAKSVPGADAKLVARAARLAKADLRSGMVGEFPELQGIMGRYYARHDGEPEAVANAIADHYSPLGPADRVPTAPVSVALALAEKIDTLVGFLAIAEKPTGSKDPFALRRAALGVIRIVLENKLQVSLSEVIRAALDSFRKSLPSFDSTAVRQELLAFIADRLKVQVRESGIRHDLVASVFALGGQDDLVRLIARVEALQGFLSGDDGANLLTAYRRAGNIVRIEAKRDGKGFDAAPESGRFTEDAERELFSALGDVEKHSAQALDKSDFHGAMNALARLRGPVDRFFDRVTVNADEAGLRDNRLRLLSQVRRALDGVADFSQIEG